MSQLLSQDDSEKLFSDHGALWHKSSQNLYLDSLNFKQNCQKLVSVGLHKTIKISISWVCKILIRQKLQKAKIQHGEIFAWEKIYSAKCPASKVPAEESPTVIRPNICNGKFYLYTERKFAFATRKIIFKSKKRIFSFKKWVFKVKQ